MLLTDATKWNRRAAAEWAAELRRAANDSLRRVASIGSRLLATRDLRRTVAHNDFARLFAVSEPLVLPGDGIYDGEISVLERATMAQLVRLFEPRRIVEIGTYRGRTTELLLANAPGDAHIWTIDLPDNVRDSESLADSSDERLIRSRDVGRAYRRQGWDGRVTQVFGDSQQAPTWREIPAEIEFAFVDASHTYEAVKKDTELLFSKLAPAAVVVWHDYTRAWSRERGVGAFLREKMPQWPGLFLVAGTVLAVKVPVEILRARSARVGEYYADESRRRRRSEALAWLSR